MSLNYVSLTVDLFDGTGSVLDGGTATFTPSVQLTDATNHEIIARAPVTAAFKPTASPVISLLATDNGTVLPNGWAWTVTFTGVAGNPASFSFFLPFASGASQRLSAISPVSTAVTQFPLNPMTTAGDMIYGAASPPGTPARLGIGSTGQVLTVSGGLPSWQPASSGFSNPMTTLGDIIYENATPAAARLAGDTSNTRKFLRTQASGGVAQAPAWDTLQAADVPQLADYAPTGLTGATAASRYVGATASGAPASGTFAVGDFAIDQSGKVWICTAAGTPGTWTAAGPTIPVTIPQGGTGQTTQQAALDALAGAVTANQVLAGNGTHVTLRALASGDIPDLAYVDTVSAGDSSVTVTGATDTPSLTSVPAQLVQRMHCV